MALNNDNSKTHEEIPEMHKETLEMHKVIDNQKIEVKKDMDMENTPLSKLLDRMKRKMLI
jgi:hypothetical protein